MKRSATALIATILWVATLWTGPALADQTTPKASPAQVAGTVKSLVEREFFKPVTFPVLEGDRVTGADIDRALAALGTSHTARYEPGTIDYLELIDILRHPIRREMKRLFPPDGEPAYEGIGVVTTTIGGRDFVSDIYGGTPAADVGIQVGDEILSVDGQPFRQLASFKGRNGRLATLSLRRKAGDAPVEVKVPVTRIRPVKTFSDAISKSMRVIERDGLGIAYLRIWALASGDIEDKITDALKHGSLKDADGLVVDLRGRWGGIFSEVPSLLMSDEPEVSFKDRSGKTSYASASYDKPVLAIIDEGTRSAQEMFAALMRKRGVRLVGMPTPGAVLATRPFVLPDDSLLVLPVAEVRIDGELLEGVGVKPDVTVDFWLPYAGGNDPQLDAALGDMTATLCLLPEHDGADTCKQDTLRAN